MAKRASATSGGHQKDRAKRLRSLVRAKPLARDAATAGFILDLLTNEIHRLKGAVGRGMYEVGNRVSLKRAADGRIALSFHAIAADDLPAFVAACERQFKLAKK